MKARGVFTQTAEHAPFRTHGRRQVSVQRRTVRRCQGHDATGFPRQVMESSELSSFASRSSRGRWRTTFPPTVLGVKRACALHTAVCDDGRVTFEGRTTAAVVRLAQEIDESVTMVTACVPPEDVLLADRGCLLMVSSRNAGYKLECCASLPMTLCQPW